MRLMLLQTWRRRRVHCSITDARRMVNGACARWYPVVKELQHVFVAIARTVVNHDVVNQDGSGGTSLHPVVWSSAANPKRRRVDRAVRDMAWLPGPASLWTSDWECCPGCWGHCCGFPGLVLFLSDIWLRSLTFLVVCIGLWVLKIWGLDVSLILSCLSCTSDGLVSDWFWKKCCLVVEGKGDQFQCRQFLLVQALIYGALAGFLVVFLSVLRPAAWWTLGG